MDDPAAHPAAQPAAPPSTPAQVESIIRRLSLLQAGFDARRPALVSWLGVTMYLPQQVTVATLVTLRRILAPGSVLIFDAYPRREETVLEEQPMFAAARALTALQGEPMVGAFHAAAFARASGRELPYHAAPRRAGDVAECYADPSYAAEVLGWRAERGIEQMCADSWRWQSSNPDGYGTAD